MTRRAHGKTGGLHSQEAGLWYLESSVSSWMTSPASPTPSWKGIQQQVLERESEADHESVDWRHLETLLQARRHWFAVEQKGSVGSGSTSTWQTPSPVLKDGREPPDLDSARLQGNDANWRTPLHYACAYGRPAVVALLVKRKCNVDLCDSDGNTPLMKALQYEEEECAIILLEHGANPNVHNNKGQTPLHYVIFYRNTLIPAKLLSYNADIEAKNTSGQTPLLLAIKKNRKMMVEFFIKNKANIHEVDDKGRTALMLAVEHKSTYIAELLLQCGVNVSASDNCGEIALSYAIASGNTANRDLILQYMKEQSRTSVNFNPVKESPKDDSLRRSIKKSHSDDSLFAMVQDSYEAPIKILPQNNVGHSFGDAHQREKDGINGHTEDTVPMSSQMNESRNFQWVRPEDILKEDTPLSSMVFQNFTHPVVQPILDRRYFLQKNTVGTTEERICKSAEPLWFSSSEEEEEGLDDTKNKQPQVFSEGGPHMCISHSSGEKHYIPKEKADGHVHASRDSSDFRKRTDPITIKKALPRKGLGKVKEKTVELAETHFDMTSEEEHKSSDDAQCTQSQVFSEDSPQMCVSHSSGEKHHKAKEKDDGHVHDSVSLSKIQKAVLSLQRIIKSKKSHCTQCSLHFEKNAQLENEIHELKKSVSEFKQENIELKQQLHNLRYTLKEDEVKRKNDDMLHEKNKNPLKEKETEFNKEDQVRKQAEISGCTIDTELETARNHFNQVSPSDGTENKLLHKYHKKKDEVSMKRLGMDTVKYQNQEKKCFENTEILREKNTSLPWTQKLNEETLMEIFQDNEQLDICKVENTLENFTPESEKQSTERPETDSLQEKKNIDVSNLNGSSEIPSQQIAKSEVKTSDLENELHQTRVMTLATDQVNRHLTQRQCQLKEMEHRYQNEERIRNERLRKQEASKEKVSKLQRESTLHEDQLHEYQNKGENKIDGIINVQTQFYDVIKNLQARNDRYRLVLENKYLELINETNHLKEQLDQYGKEKAEEMDDLTAKMKNTSSKHLHLRTNYECFMQNLFFIRSIQDTFEKIERNQKKLEENVVNFPRHTRSTRVERGQGVRWECDIEHRARWDLEEKQKQTQEAAPEITEQFRKTNFTSIRSQMELRISHLESELKILRNATERI